MAKAELSIILDKLSGRLDGKSRFYTSQRYGQTVISNYPLRKDPKALSDSQRATFASFGQVSKQTKAEMSDPERLAYWQAQYEQYKKTAKSTDKYYSTLRGFILAQLRKTTD